MNSHFLLSTSELMCGYLYLLGYLHPLESIPLSNYSPAQTASQQAHNNLSNLSLKPGDQGYLKLSRYQALCASLDWTSHANSFLTAQKDKYNRVKLHLTGREVIFHSLWPSQT